MNQLNAINGGVPTLGSTFADFRVHRKLKKGTTDYYDKMLSIYLKEWLDIPITYISRDDIQNRHTFITMNAGPTAANVTMRILSVILNYAIFRYRGTDNEPILKENPVILLTQLRSWNKLRPKHRYIRKDQLAQWYQAVISTRSDNLRDSLLLMIFTGLRKSEVSNLMWKNVDFNDRSFLIEDPKNGKDHLLPMSSFVFELLWVRRQRAKSAWIFPNKLDNGPMHTATSSYERISYKCGVKFSPHDLRRSFVNVGRSVRVDHYTLKQLLNHSGGNDVTFSCYTLRDIEVLREPVERIAYALRQYLGVDMRMTSVRVVEDLPPIPRIAMS